MKEATRQREPLNIHILPQNTTTGGPPDTITFTHCRRRALEHGDWAYLAEEEGAQEGHTESTEKQERNGTRIFQREMLHIRMFSDGKREEAERQTHKQKQGLSELGIRGLEGRDGRKGGNGMGMRGIAHCERNHS
ncbi:hypothetical protein E2C01_095220 [Portunus trituberculatus]|uniref:Uncharacterized protein n=1 Tax=Portunus trituberculatus TaxID=210409 RepID=A0A5B7JZM1_PORTR|nr:hypothetical protein [Portunus trituberculatus]